MAIRQGNSQKSRKYDPRVLLRNSDTRRDQIAYALHNRLQSITPLTQTVTKTVAAAPITSFTDGLTTIDPNGGSFLGTNWFNGQKADTSSNTPTDLMTAQIQQSSHDLTNALCWIGYGAQNPQVTLRGVALPAPLYNSAVLGATQYVQITFVYGTGDSIQSRNVAGWLLQCDPSDAFLTAYVFGVQITAAAGPFGWNLWRVNSSGFTALTNGTGIAWGDVLRGSADESNASQVVITMKQNGSTLATYTDTAAARLNRGIPGLWGQVTIGTTSTSSHWRTFSAGIGT